MFNLKPKPSADGLPVAKILPFRKRKSVVALDLEGDLVRVAQATGHGSSVRLTRIASAPLNLPSGKRENAGELGAALKAALASIKISPKDAVLSLPRAQVVLRPLQVPMVADARELASIINFQIAKDLPFRLEDAVIDFKVLRQVEVPASERAAGTEAATEKRLEVLVGAVQSDIVEFYRQSARAAGLKLGALGLRSVAAAYCAGKCIQTSAGTALLLLCARPDETTIEITVDSKLVFSRAAAVSFPAASDRSEADQSAFLQAVEIEVVRSLHSYEGTPGHRPLQKVAVAGGTGLEKAIRDLLSARLNLPSELLDPAACFKSGVTESAEAAIAPIGLALSALENGGLSLDFANPKKPAVQRDTKRTKALLAAVAGVALLFILFGVRHSLIQKRLRVKQEAQVQLADAERKLPIYRRLKTQAKLVNAWIADDQNWLDHLAYLSSILPPAEQLYVSTFTTSPQHLIRFSIQAKTGELLAELDKKLRAAGYEVRPLSITPANDKNGYNFRTTVELSIPKKMKPDLAKAKPQPRPSDDVSAHPPRKSS